MFGWKFSEIIEECELLGKAGYLGAKLSPINEHLMSDEPENGVLNPWYYVFQPLSYKLNCRYGTSDELATLIQTCRANGVRVYVDVVLNHFTGPIGACKSSGKKSSAPLDRQSPFYTYEDNNPAATYEYPGATFGPEDFHCERALDKWDDLDILNNGWLAG